jgi:cytochrome c553
MRTLTLTLLASVLGACPAAAPTPDPGAPPAGAPAEPVASGAMAPTPDWAGVHGHMKDHLIQLDNARQAVVSGRLEPAKTNFRWLSEHTPVAGLPDGWLPYVDAMQGAAAQGELAPNFTAAGSALGTVAETCGACHAANDVSITFPMDPAPIAEPGSAGHMRRHAWASDRMWEGLIGPSDERWEQGVRMLNEHVLHKLSNGTELPPEVAVFDKRVHDIGADALAGQGSADRAALFGDFIAQCAACHTTTGEGPQ